MNECKNYSFIVKRNKMKKILIALLILVAIVTVVIVGLIGWTANTNQRLNVNQFTMTKLETKNMNVAEKINSIDISVRTAAIQVRTGQKANLQLTNVGQKQCQIKQIDGQLSITENNFSKHQWEVGQSAKIILTLPPKTLNHLQIEQLNGTLKLNDLTVKDLQLQHSNGTTIARKLTITGHGELDKHNGRTDLYQLTSDGLDVSVKSGQFKLNGIKKAGSGQRYRENGSHPLIIKSGSGQVRIVQ